MTDEERKAIEYTKQFLTILKNSKLINAQDVRIKDIDEEYLMDLEKVLNLIEKKDKIIDLMAEQLTTPIHSKEWVIEYYTKKVEDK